MACISRQDGGTGTTRTAPGTCYFSPRYSLPALTPTRTVRGSPSDTMPPE